MSGTQFDQDLGSCGLVGGKTKLQQFANLQQALSNAVSNFCTHQPDDVKHVIKHLEEVVINELVEPTKEQLDSKLRRIIADNYVRQMDKWDKRISNYTSNNSIICGVVLRQCDTSVQSKLAITAGWEANKSNLLFVLKAAQVACIGVQKKLQPPRCWA